MSEYLSWSFLGQASLTISSFNVFDLINDKSVVCAHGINQFCGNGYTATMMGQLVVFFAGIVTCAINLYGFICGLCIMSGRKLNYYLTLKVPISIKYQLNMLTIKIKQIMFCWVAYAGAVGAWTLLNVILLQNLQIGYWVFVGAAGASLLLRYHFRLYHDKLKQIRTFILLMGD